MKRWAIVLGLALLAIVVLADTGRLGILHVIYDFPYGDKLGHFGLFGLLSLLAGLAAIEGRPAAGSTARVLRISLILAVLIGLEEWSQRFFSTRTASVLDLAASYAGVAFFSWLALRIAPRKGEPLDRVEGAAPGA